MSTAEVITKAQFSAHLENWAFFVELIARDFPKSCWGTFPIDLMLVFALYLILSWGSRNIYQI
jgi:hypothetical protein